MKVISKTGKQYDCKWSIPADAYLTHAWVDVYVVRTGFLARLFPWKKVAHECSSVDKEEARLLNCEETRKQFQYAANKYEFALEYDAKERAKKNAAPACPDAWKL